MLKKTITLSITILAVALLYSCQEPIPPKDMQEYITPLEDGNTWITHFHGTYKFFDIVDGDTIDFHRKLYMTNVIDGDTIINGIKCKLYHTYYHHNRTINDGDTVYTSHKCPQIFPNAVYICGVHENLSYDDIVENLNDPDYTYAKLTYFAEKLNGDNPEFYYEEDFIINKIYSTDYGWRTVPIIALNVAKGDSIFDFKVEDVSSITLADGKERRYIKVGTHSNGLVKHITHYWIEGIGATLDGINKMSESYIIFRPTIYDKVISFSTHGEEIYTAEDSDL